MVKTEDRENANVKSNLIMLSLKKSFFVIALVSVEELVSVEGAPSAPLRGGK